MACFWLNVNVNVKNKQKEGIIMRIMKIYVGDFFTTIYLHAYWFKLTSSRPKFKHGISGLHVELFVTATHRTKLASMPQDLIPQ